MLIRFHVAFVISEVVDVNERLGIQGEHRKIGIRFVFGPFYSHRIVCTKIGRLDQYFDEDRSNYISVDATFDQEGEHILGTHRGPNMVEVCPYRREGA